MSKNEGRVEISRRNFLRGSALGAAATVALPGLQGLASSSAQAASGQRPRRARRGRGGYGPLERRKPKAAYTSFPGAADVEWLALPPGFEYVVFGIAGDVMSDGYSTPSAHDGMAAFKMGKRRYRLVRNHEARDAVDTEFAKSIGGDFRAYNPLAGGGTTTLEIVAGKDGCPKLEKSFVSLNGTSVNCAGGLTPAGSWISSEETTETREGVKHGYNFDVPADANGAVEPYALKQMGRFAHEAVAVDPKTGIVYETEDAGDSGFFQYVPNRKRDLSTGLLQMLKIQGETNTNLKGDDPDSWRPLPGDRFRCEWVTIDHPDPDVPEDDMRKAVYNQGIEKGAATFGRLEGCWYNEVDRSIIFTCTNGGVVGEGQVWEYKPRGKDEGKLTLLFESPDGNILSAPDNLASSPGGGILLCEDHGFDRPDDPFAPLPWAEEGDDDQVEVQYMKGLTEYGEIFDFAANILDDKEWAGATFSHDGRYLFANTQGNTRGFVADYEDPDNRRNFGRTYAIWGPWKDGAFGRRGGRK